MANIPDSDRKPLPNVADFEWAVAQGQPGVLDSPKDLAYKQFKADTKARDILNGTNYAEDLARREPISWPNPFRKDDKMGQMEPISLRKPVTLGDVIKKTETIMAVSNKDAATAWETQCQIALTIQAYGISPAISQEIADELMQTVFKTPSKFPPKTES